MSVAVHITPKQMSRDDYERMIEELDATGASDPKGRTFHAAYGQEKVHMFEIWDSEEDFETHRDRLFAVLEGSGVEGGTVNVHPLHSGHPD